MFFPSRGMKPLQMGQFVHPNATFQPVVKPKLPPFFPKIDLLSHGFDYFTLGLYWAISVLYVYWCDSARQYHACGLVFICAGSFSVSLYFSFNHKANSFCSTCELSHAILDLLGSLTLVVKGKHMMRLKKNSISKRKI